MIIAGNVAVAPEDDFRFVGFGSRIRALPWCLNLEGALVPDVGALPAWGVYNTERWTSGFSGFEIGPVFLGNNHIHDLTDGVNVSLRRLRENGFAVFGAGANLEAAGAEAVVRSGAFDYCLLGFGWRVIGCRPAGALAAGVNPLEGGRALHAVERVRQRNPGKRIVVIIHGNYEFELHPQPAHRQLAKSLIDHGAYAVIFHHPHVVGAIERYQGHTIAYSVGNWAFSYGKFFGGRLRFPATSFAQIAIEFGDRADTVHHARFVPPSTVEYEFSELVGSDRLSIKAEFEGFSDEGYLAWFRGNRVKRKGLPIYQDAHASLGNSFRDAWVWGRQVLIDTAVKLRLKSTDRNGVILRR